jgi:arylsulfatase
VSDGNPNKPREKGWQLFDLKSDPGEQHDVAAANAETVARLDAAYDKWWADVVPMMVNEKAEGPNVNPFKELYWRQFPDERPKGN